MSERLAVRGLDIQLQAAAGSSRFSGMHSQGLTWPGPLRTAHSMTRGQGIVAATAPAAACMASRMGSPLLCPAPSLTSCTAGCRLSSRRCSNCAMRAIAPVLAVPAAQGHPCSALHHPSLLHRMET